MAGQDRSNTYLPHRLKLPSFDLQPAGMAEQDVPPVDLVHFPYFPDGDIIISLSPSDVRPMRLHSEVLVKYLGYFQERLKGHVYLRALARSSRIEGLKGPGTMRYELVCRKGHEGDEWEGEGEMGMLELKQIPTSVLLRYRPTIPIRRAYALLFALIYEDYADTDAHTLRNFPSLEDTLQFHHLYRIWKAYSCTLHNSPLLASGIDSHVRRGPSQSRTTIAVLTRPWHVLPLACLIRSKRLYKVAFNAVVWHQFQYHYGASTRRTIVGAYHTLQGSLDSDTRDATEHALRRITAALGGMTDTIVALDMRRWSLAAQTIWRCYFQRHVTQNGHCEADLEFYRDLWHEKLRSSMVIAFYRNRFRDETEMYYGKGYFVVRREIRDILVAVKKCVKPLFFSDKDKEYGTLCYDPLVELCEVMDREVIYPWERQLDSPPVKEEGMSDIEEVRKDAMKRGDSDMRDNTDGGRESQQEILREEKKRMG